MREQLRARISITRFMQNEPKSHLSSHRHAPRERRSDDHACNNPIAYRDAPTARRRLRARALVGLAAASIRLVGLTRDALPHPHRNDVRPHPDRKARDQTSRTGRASSADAVERAAPARRAVRARAGRLVARAPAGLLARRRRPNPADVAGADLARGVGGRSFSAGARPRRELRRRAGVELATAGGSTRRTRGTTSWRSRSDRRGRARCATAASLARFAQRSRESSARRRSSAPGRSRRTGASWGR